MERKLSLFSSKRKKPAKEADPKKLKSDLKRAVSTVKAQVGLTNRSKRSTNGAAKPASISKNRLEDLFVNAYRNPTPFTNLPGPCGALSSVWRSERSYTIFPLNEEAGKLEFKFHGEEGEYIHPLFLLRFDFQILRENGDKLVETMVRKPDGTSGVEMDKVAPLNYFHQTLWSQAAVTLNNTLITPTENARAVVTYLNLLLDYDEAARTNMAQAALYAKEDSIEFQARDPTESGATDIDSLKWRTGMTKKSNVCQLEGPLVVNGLYTGGRLIPPGVKISVMLQRASSAFALLTPESNKTKYKVSITDAELQVLRIRPTPVAAAAYVKSVENFGFTALPLLQKETQTFSVAAGAQKATFICFEGQLPETCSVVMVESAAHNGDFHKNPLAFGNFGLKSIGFDANGRSMPAVPLDPDFAKNNYTRLYLHTIIAKYGCALNLQNVTFPISYEDYANNQCIITFRTASYAPGAPEPADTGVLRLNLEFANPLAKAVTIIVIGDIKRAALIKPDGAVRVLPRDKRSIEQMQDALEDDEALDELFRRANHS